MNNIYIFLLILSIFPFLYKYSFWFYAIQLKEYRGDRFREYIWTKQWKSAILNIWSVLEVCLFLIFLFLVSFLSEISPYITYKISIIFLMLENIFVIYKIYKWSIKKPKLTLRLILTVSILLLLLIAGFLFFNYYDLFNFIYFYILFLFIFTPLIIFFVIFLSLPLVNYLKKKKIEKAIKKSIYITNPIKVWVTWSYGKSSVKESLSSILEQDWKTLKTPENVNSELWVSDIVLNKISDEYKYFVAEMWAYKKWEIDTLWKIVNHKYWFLTAIWNQHIALFGSQKNIIDWKSEIANSVLKNNWILYINWDNEFIREIKFDKNLNIVRYWSFDADANFKIKEINDWKTIFSFNYKDIKEDFETNLLWKHNIINLSWVIAFCYDIWLSTEKIRKYLKNIKSPKSTLNMIKKDNLILIDDTYNLSRDWLYAWLDSISNLTWEKILVSDDILELWKDAKKVHYEAWKYISSQKKVKKVLFCWVNYKDDFIKWLLDWWYDENNILEDLYKIEDNSIILFEWLHAKKYLDKLVWWNIPK